MQLHAELAALSPSAQTSAPSRDTARNVAQSLEASFVSEMLKHTGLGLKENSFGTGSESQFASFHREALAKEIVRSGGLGLTELIFEAVLERSSDG